MLFQKITIVLLVLFALCYLEIEAAETPVVPYIGPSGEMVLSMSPLWPIVLSPDNTLMACSSSTGIYFWDLLPKPKLRKAYLPSDTAEIDKSAFLLPDNRLLVVSSVIQVFDLNTLELKKRIPLDAVNEDLSIGVTASLVSVSHDGKFVVMKRYQPYRMQLWNIEKGLKMAETLLEENKVSLFASFSPDGSKILLTGRDGRADLWDASNLQFIRSMQDGNGHYYKHCFSPDGRFAVAATSDGYLVKWDISTGKKLFEVSNHHGRISNIFFTPDGKKILTSHESSYMERNGKTDVPIPLNEGSALILCDAETGKESKRLVSSIMESSCMAMGDNKVYGVDRNSRITCWDLETGEIINQFGEEFSQPIYFDASPDTTQFAAVIGFSRIDVYDRKTLRVIRSIDNGEKCEKIQYSPNGKLLLVINSGGTLTIRDTATGSLKQKIKLENGVSLAASRQFINNTVQFFPDNQHLLVHSMGGLEVYDIETGTRTSTYSYGSQDIQIYCACVSPTGEAVVSTSKFLERWDSSFKNKLSSDSFPITQGSDTLAFTDDGSILYVLSQSSHSAIDAKTGKSVRLIPNSNKILFWIDTWMERDLLMLFEDTYRSNNPVESLIVNWKTGEQVAKIPGAYLAKFTPDKSCIISNNSNYQLIVWETNRVLKNSSSVESAILYKE